MRARGIRSQRGRDACGWRSHCPTFSSVHYTATAMPFIYIVTLGTGSLGVQKCAKLGNTLARAVRVDRSGQHRRNYPLRPTCRIYIRTLYTYMCTQRLLLFSGGAHVTSSPDWHQPIRVLPHPSIIPTITTRDRTHPVIKIRRNVHAPRTLQGPLDKRIQKMQPVDGIRLRVVMTYHGDTPCSLTKLYTTLRIIL